MTHIRASAGFGLQNLRPGRIILHCNSGSVLHQMSEFFLIKTYLKQLKPISTMQKIFLYSTLDVTLHKNFDEMDPFGDVTIVEDLRDGYFYVKELKLELHKELDSPGAPCISDEKYSYSKES